QHQGEGEFRVAEFFSGIGGMHCALQLLRQLVGGEREFSYRIAGAFDVNNIANSVYERNFPGVRVCTASLDSIGLARVRALAANLWLMSPPCQPFSRLGNRRGLDDARCRPLLRLLKVLASLPDDERPSRLLLENVQGFEASPAAERLLECLNKCGYEYRQLLLSPLQFSVPNSRLRFYLLAWRPGAPEPAAARLLPANCLIDRPPSAATSQPLLPSCCCPVCSGRLQPGQLTHDSHLRCYRPFARPLSDYLSPGADAEPELYLTSRQLEQFFPVLDIRQPRSRATCCFTKGYGKRVEGTGSVLQTRRLAFGKPSHDRVKAGACPPRTHGEVSHADSAAAAIDASCSSLAPDDLSDDDINNGEFVDSAGGSGDAETMQAYAESLGLRYLSAAEVAGLMHFPPGYSFSTSLCLSRRQAYQLLGNSVNVLVIAHLLSYLLLS
uniref:tRNA (cytosine(38)-C(5))-methyltransferase n=2 Tax=Macrostomum lignano TaxID=282301 RepID=A0A1I8HR47_9PLAT